MPAVVAALNEQRRRRAEHGIGGDGLPGLGDWGSHAQVT
jgi:hypothetical protein